MKVAARCTTATQDKSNKSSSRCSNSTLFVTHSSSRCKLHRNLFMGAMAALWVLTQLTSASCCMLINFSSSISTSSHTSSSKGGPAEQAGDHPRPAKQAALSSSSSTSRQMCTLLVAALLSCWRL